MRLLYFGDRHEKLNAPENRIDDYHASTEAKDYEIMQIGRKNQVKAFLQPGDFFDTPNPPLDFASKVISKWSNVNVYEILERMTSKKKIDFDLFVNEYFRDMLHGKYKDIDEAKKKLESVYTEDDFKKDKEELEKKLKDYIPIVGIAGNHELFGNNIKTLPKTMLGFMEKLGLMRFATKENPYFLYTEDGLKVAITGTHYHIDIDKPEHIDDYVVEEKLGDIHIHMVHGYLTDKSKGDLFRHTLIDQIKHTKADLTITGHDHIGFPLTEVDGKYFVNTGAIPRLSNDLKEMNRQVKVLLIDITKEHGLRLKEIPLKSALPGDKVLSRAKINEKKQKDIRIEEFKKTIRDAGLKKGTDITEIVRDIADSRKLPLIVKTQAMERLAEKMALMKPPNEGIAKEAYITKVILENFQSHEYTELELSKGFNIFVGESKQGKTSILRAIDWVYENKPSGKRIVRKGAEYARVTLYLSNGYIISRYIEAKKSGKNGYEITDPKTGEVEFSNTKILSEVQKILGFSYLKIDEDSKYNLNYLKQGTGWFMIGENYSAPQKAKMIGGIYGTQYADAVIRDLDSQIKRSNEKIKISNKILTNTKSELEKFDYLEDLNKSILQVEATLKKIEELTRKKELIQSLLVKHKKITGEMEENEKILSALQNLDESIRLSTNVKLAFNRRTELDKLNGKYAKTSHSLNELNKTLKAVEQLDIAKEKFNELQLLVVRRDKLEKVTEKHNKLLQSIAEEDNIIVQTNQVERARQRIDNLKIGFNKRNEIELNLEKYARLLHSVKQENEIIEQTSFLENAKLLFEDIQNKQNVRYELVNKVQRAKELDEKRAKEMISLEAIQQTLEQTNNIELAKNKLNEVKMALERRDKLVQLSNKWMTLSKEIQKETGIIVTAEKNIGQDIQKYQDVLEQAGKCPVCFGTVDKATINRIVKELIKEDNQKGVLV